MTMVARPNRTQLTDRRAFVKFAMTAQSQVSRLSMWSCGREGSMHSVQEGVDAARAG